MHSEVRERPRQSGSATRGWYKKTTIVTAILLGVVLRTAPTDAQDLAAQTQIYLCNETSEVVHARLVLGDGTQEHRTLRPEVGCFSLRLPRYAGSVAFAGSSGTGRARVEYGAQRLNARFGQGVWAYYRSSDDACAGRATYTTACLSPIAK